MAIVSHLKHQSVFDVIDAIDTMKDHKNIEATKLVSISIFDIHIILNQ